MYLRTVTQYADRKRGLSNMSDPLEPTPAGNLYLQTLGRGIMLLELLSSGPLTMREIAAATTWNRSTVYRLVWSLEYHGLVAKGFDDGTVRLSSRLWEIGLSAVGTDALSNAAADVVRRLVDKFGETVHLAVYSTGEVVYIAKGEGWQPIRSYTELGGRAPAHAVATGKVLLAFQSADEIERRVKSAIAYTPRTITSHEELLKELDLVRTRGYALNRGEWREDVGGIAVPVRSRSGTLIAALGFSGPRQRILAREPELLEELRNASIEIGNGT